MWRRSAIRASGIVVCERNSQASSTFLGSPFRRACRSASLQPIRFNPSTTRRSACTASASPAQRSVRARGMRQPKIGSVAMARAQCSKSRTGGNQNDPSLTKTPFPDLLLRVRLGHFLSLAQHLKGLVNEFLQLVELAGVR